MLPPHCPHPPGGYVNRARALSRCGGKLALEPGPGPPQALGQRDARSISEQALGPLEICERVTYVRSEEHTSELQSQSNLVCRLLLEKKKDSDTNARAYRLVSGTASSK